MKKLSLSNPLPLKNVRINDTFWSRYIQLVRDVVIPYQWEALNDRIPDAEPSHAIQNFRIAAGEEQGEFYGMVFQDSDVAKWLEAVGYTLATHPDPQLENLADGVIDLISRAQQEDGYLNTYFTVKEPGNRWTNLYDCHELYCAGHMMEAAVAYYEATGKRKLLEVMCRFADHIASVFGPEAEKLKGYCGHEEIELALVKLYKVTGNEKYLKLSKYFIDERGRKPYYFDIEWEKRGRISHWSKNVSGRPSKNAEYNQTHLPVREQTRATGHAVRAVYLYTAMADLAAKTGDEGLLEACRTLWDNIVSKQMYITGGIGSTHHGEAFTFDYDLPNDTVYQETCASIGFIFFAQRMLQMEANGCYADALERALYNSVISGMALDGKSFFYVNPMEVWPEASEKNPGKHHVKPVRQKWYGCACCPPNIARLLSSLGEYIYTSNSNTLYTHLFIGGEAEIGFDGGSIRVKQETNYPWDGKVRVEINGGTDKEFTWGFRIPGWCRKAELRVNGETINLEGVVQNGYALLKRLWKAGDCVEFELEMPVELIQSNPKVRANAGKVAIQRGPLVYCLEETDNGANLQAVSLCIDRPMTAEFNAGKFGGMVEIHGEGKGTDESSWNNELYRPFERKEVDIGIKAVPYCLWGNRSAGEMSVWMRFVQDRV